MTKPFTDIDLIRYIYGETSSNETNDIKQALVLNPELVKALNDLTLEMGVLDRLLVAPSEFITKEIFKYSLNYSLENKTS